MERREFATHPWDSAGRDGVEQFLVDPDLVTHASPHDLAHLARQLEANQTSVPSAVSARVWHWRDARSHTDDKARLRDIRERRADLGMEQRETLQLQEPPSPVRNDLER